MSRGDVDPGAYQLNLTAKTPPDFLGQTADELTDVLVSITRPRSAQ